ncbi:hypothetical protein AAG906_039068 [Vitis piasezkii]
MNPKDPKCVTRVAQGFQFTEQSRIEVPMKPLSQLSEPNFLHLRLFDQNSHIYSRILLSIGYLASDNYTFMFLVCTSAQLLVHGIGSSTHGAVAKYGFEHEPHVQSGLIYINTGLGGLVACYWVSSSICEPDLV